MAKYEDVVKVAFEMAVGGDWKQRRPGRKRPVAEGFTRYRVSRRGKRALEIRAIDREADLWSQKVWEQDESGQWKLVHDDVGPLSKK